MSLTSLRSWRPALAWVLLFVCLTTTWAQQPAPPPPPPKPISAPPPPPARPAPPLTEAEKALSADVKLDTIKNVTAALSALDMQGRGTMQPGGDKAAQYIADYYARLKFKPLGKDGSYLQPIDFKETRFTPETSLKIGDETLQLGRDFVPEAPLSGDEDIKGEMVFIAYGLDSGTPKRSDLMGVDVRGKIVVMMYGPPRNVTEEAWRKAKAQRFVMRNLFFNFPSAFIFINNGHDRLTNGERVDYGSRRQMTLADEKDWPKEAPPFLSVSEQAADKLFAKVGLTYQQALEKAEQESFRPYKLQQTAQIKVRYKSNKGKANNVVGLLEGSDPQLKAEALVYSAHYDAFGLAADGRIYPGAADNALGVAEMLAVAEALANAPAKPRRSVIFLAVTGEEYGLYGAEYWAGKPTWDIKRVAADLNLDGMGTEVYGPVKTLVGYGVEHSELGLLLRDVAEAQGLKVIPDPMPDERSFYRSDHYAFVKKGVPGIMILGAPAGPPEKWIDRMKQWEKTDYHQPTDTIKPDWDWSGPHIVAQICAVIGWRAANADKMVAWFPASPFNRERGTKEDPPEEP